MKRLAPLLAAALASVVILPGCGGSSSVHHPTTTGPPQVAVNPHFVHEPSVKELFKREASKFAAPKPLKHISASKFAARAPVPATPVGPSGAWKVVYADNFSAQIGSGAGQDATWKANEHDQGCCSNGDEIAAERPSKVRTSEAGLEVLCDKEPNAGKAYTCGGADGNTPKGFKWKFGGGQTWAFTTEAKAPPASNCAEDPGWWASDPSWTDEMDFFEFWGWNNNCKYSGGVPVWIYKTPSSSIRNQCTPWEGCGTYIKASPFAAAGPDGGYHVYTTVVRGNNEVEEWVDGIHYATISGASPNTPWEHLIVTHALRTSGTPLAKGSSVFGVHYTAVYEIGSGNTENGSPTAPNLAPGTTVSGEPLPPPPPPTTTEETTPTPPPPTEGAPATPTGCKATDHREGTTAWVSGTCTPSTGATSYRVYRAGEQPSGTPAEGPWTILTAPSFSNHIKVILGNRECYWESAVNSHGASALSPEFCIQA